MLNINMYFKIFDKQMFTNTNCFNTYLQLFELQFLSLNVVWNYTLTIVILRIKFFHILGCDKNHW